MCGSCAGCRKGALFTQTAREGGAQRVEARDAGHVAQERADVVRAEVVDGQAAHADVDQLFHTHIAEKAEHVVCVKTEKAHHDQAPFVLHRRKEGVGKVDQVDLARRVEEDVAAFCVAMDVDQLFRRAAARSQMRAQLPAERFGECIPVPVFQRRFSPLVQRGASVRSVSPSIASMIR